MDLAGLFVPALTFFTQKDESIDLGLLDSHIEFLVSSGVDGIVSNGSTGDFQALTTDERTQVTRAIIRTVGGRLPVVAGTTSLTTKGCVEASVEAEEMGAAGVMIAPPFYLPLTDDELCWHYERVSHEIRIPILAYNNPLCTGQNLTPQLIARLRDAAGIRHVKESSGVFDNLQEILLRTDGQVRVLMGEEPLSLAALLTGASGLVMGLANAVPEVFTQLLGLLREARSAEAAKLHQGALPLYRFSANMREVDYNSVIKSILKLRFGTPATFTRAPSLPLSDAQEETLRVILGDMGLLSA